MRIDQLSWAWKRLQRMPPAELPHRVREALRHRRDRKGELLQQVRQRTGSAIAERPLPGWPLPQELSLWTDRNGERLRMEREQLLEGSFLQLGIPRSASTRRAWSADPAGGSDWPRSGADFRHGHEGRDIKLVWELGRLQHLQRLALAARALGCPRSRQACLEDLQSWVRAHPPYEGVAYASGIELACRIHSLLVIIGLLGPGSFPEPLRQSLWRTLAAHGAWLHRYPSWYSSANNHRVAELGGLILLGALAPELPGARAQLQPAASELTREILRQIHPDGVGAEQAPGYQGFTMEWALTCREALRQTGQLGLLGSGVDQRLIAGARFLSALRDGGGHRPQIGDFDEGVVFATARPPQHYLDSIVSAVARIFPQAEGLQAEDRDDWRGLMLCSRLPCDASASTPPGSAHFPAGGYTCLRRGQGEDEILVVMDHAELGLGPLHAHGHADALSVWLHLGGQPVLVDSGTYRYNGAADWRRWMMSTAAHNTVEVAGRSSSLPAGPFAWEEEARVRLEEAELPEGPVTGSHDGYRALGVTHRRRVELSGERLIVRDELEGSGEQEVLVTWNWAPGLSVTPGEQGLEVRRGERLLLRLQGPWEHPDIRRQCDAPGPGARSPRYNQLEPGCTLQFRKRLRLPASWTSTFELLPSEGV